MPSFDQVLATIEAIYDAGMDEAQWEHALERLATLLGSTATTVAFQDGATRFPAYYSIRYDSNSDRAYAEHYRRVDPILAFASRAPVGVYTNDMVMPKAELRRTEIHSDFGLANDMDSVMQAFAFRTPDCAGLIATGRSRRAGDFELEQVETLGLLLPHFERAMRLQLRLRATHIQANSATEALDRLTVGMILTDRRAQVVVANRAAEVLLAQADGIGVDASGLRGTAPSSTSALRRLIASAADRTRLTGRGGALKLDRPSMRGPLLVRVAPLGAAASASWTPEPRPAVMVLVSDPDCARDTLTDELRALYGLTPTEAAVAAAVGEGRGVKEAADALGIAHTTLRWHLQRVFEKTGTTRQAQLTRLVERLGLVSGATASRGPGEPSSQT